jgi:hypothetical protein
VAESIRRGNPRASGTITCLREARGSPYNANRASGASGSRDESDFSHLSRAWANGLREPDRG